MSQASNYLPDVLQSSGSNSAISVLRALKNALEVINDLVPDENYNDSNVQAAVDDLQFMISRTASGRKMDIQSI